MYNSKRAAASGITTLAGKSRALKAGRAAQRDSGIYSKHARFSKMKIFLSLMSEFRILEHTADVGFEAFGATREEMFANAGRALLFLITDPDSVRESNKTSIQLEAGDPASLLVDWLSEILYLYDAENWLFCGFEIQRLTDLSISAAGHGERFDPARHHIKLLVKAITYHQLAVEQNAEGWRCQVYVDI